MNTTLKAETLCLPKIQSEMEVALDSAAVSIFVYKTTVILVELTNTVFVNSTNITTNIEPGVLSRYFLPNAK